MKSDLIKKTGFVSQVITHSTPVMLVYFITAQCNAKCRFCFYETNPGALKDELKLEEIEKISASMGSVYWLLLSGGEPFLRNDLADICRIFVKNNNVQYLQIPTNAWNSKRITEITRKILEENPEIPDLIINVSIDHIGKKHDAIRGVPGLYKRLCKTVNSLHNLKSKFKNLGVAANITYSGYNYKDIFNIFQTVKKTLPLDNISLTLTRGIPKEKKALDFLIDNYYLLFDMINKDEKQYRYYSKLKKIFARGKDLYKKKIIYNAYTEKSLTVPCRAGRDIGVMTENGNIHACELLNDRLGNIRDFDYDFKKLWGSEQVKKIRKKISKTNCFCTYECVIGPNILFNPVFFLKSFFKGMLLK